MPEQLRLQLATADATELLGQALAQALGEPAGRPFTVFLRGDLGAGKTTLVRGWLRAMGHGGRVPSPTYTLVEPYEAGGWRIWHLDLYRLGDGAELEYLGLAEMLEPGNLVLIEWPERGVGYLPDNDLQIELKVNSMGRAARLRAATPAAEALLEACRIPAGWLQGVARE